MKQTINTSGKTRVQINYVLTFASFRYNDAKDPIERWESDHLGSLKIVQPTDPKTKEFKHNLTPHIQLADGSLHRAKEYVRDIIKRILVVFVVELNMVPEVVIATCPGMFIRLTLSFYKHSDRFFVILAAMNHLAYNTIKSIFNKLGIYVPLMISEPIASMIHYEFSLFKAKRDDGVFPKHDIPQYRCLDCTLTADLGAGN